MKNKTSAQTLRLVTLGRKNVDPLKSLPSIKIKDAVNDAEDAESAFNTLKEYCKLHWISLAHKERTKIKSKSYGCYIRK